jgi:multidrug efflux system outer membrane protein
VNLGISSFEIDLWGRLRNQASAGFETYLSTQSGMRSTKLSLVQETALAYATLASDEDLLTIAKDTATSAQRSLDLTQSLMTAGLGNAGDVESARTVLAQAQSDMASATTQVAQDRNALDLLVGEKVDEALLPTSLAEVDGTIALAPAGISSTVLLQRPDVVEAEHTLKGANYSIGAARARLLPHHQPDCGRGLLQQRAQPALQFQFQGWSVSPSGSLPILGARHGPIWTPPRRRVTPMSPNMKRPCNRPLPTCPMLWPGAARSTTSAARRTVWSPHPSAA